MSEQRIEIVACTEADMDLSGIAEYDDRERWLNSPHTDCEHVEFDLLENCRICNRHRSECEA